MPFIHYLIDVITARFMAHVLDSDRVGQNASSVVFTQLTPCYTIIKKLDYWNICTKRAMVTAEIIKYKPVRVFIAYNVRPISV